MNLGQLKILQEVITLAVFVPFSVFYMKEELRLDYLWAGLCLLGAVFSSSAPNCPVETVPPFAAIGPAVYAIE